MKKMNALKKFISIFNSQFSGCEVGMELFRGVTIEAALEPLAADNSAGCCQGRSVYVRDMSDIATIAHELTHALQYTTGRLTNLVYCKKEDNARKYLDQWCEREAFAVADYIYAQTNFGEARWPKRKPARSLRKKINAAWAEYATAAKKEELRYEKNND